MTAVDKIAIQLYTVREMAAEDLAGTLKTIANIGYRNVELAGFYGNTAEQIRTLMDEHGLKVASAHIPVTDFQNDLGKVVSDLQTLGAPWGVVPWIHPDNRTEADLRAYGEQFNVYADALAAAGIKFGYHNHDFEFTTKTDTGSSLFDMLIGMTDPAKVFFELDAWWVTVAGLDPAEVLGAHSDRIKLVHLKDGFSANAKAGADVPFGEGDQDFGAFLEAAARAGVEYYITEQDTRVNVVPEITASFNNARTVLA
jgi:sugar phosphate isomerase/epimerase